MFPAILSQVSHLHLIPFCSRGVERERFHSFIISHLHFWKSLCIHPAAADAWKVLQTWTQAYWLDMSTLSCHCRFCTWAKVKILQVMLDQTCGPALSILFYFFIYYTDLSCSNIPRNWYLILNAQSNNNGNIRMKCKSSNHKQKVKKLDLLLQHFMFAENLNKMMKVN